MGNKGFTLLEIVVVLLIFGLVTGFMGFSFFKMTQGIIFVGENAKSAQEAQAALIRLEKEVRELLDISSTSSTSMTLTQTNGKNTIGYVSSDSEKKITINNATLLENVTSFKISYYAGADKWVEGLNGLRDLSAIEVKFTIKSSQAGDSLLDFTSRVSPRNNNNMGGAPPGSNSPSIPDFGCFVDTLLHDFN